MSAYCGGIDVRDLSATEEDEGLSDHKDVVQKVDDSGSTFKFVLFKKYYDIFNDLMLLFFTSYLSTLFSSARVQRCGFVEVKLA